MATRQPKKIELSTGDRLTLNCVRMHEAATRASARLQLWIEASSLKDLSYAIRGRVKTREDIENKVLRKRDGDDGEKPKPEYEPATMTDAYGFRVITLFQMDMVDTVRRLLMMVNHDPSIAGSQFTENNIREIRVFTNRPDNDPLSWTEDIFGVVRDFGYGHLCPKKPEHSATGYSSVHLILHTDVGVENEDKKINTQPFPVEVQIRSVFEDAWGEIDHKLRYEEKRKKLDQQQIKHLKHWTPHLNALKTYVDGCTQYADLIKGQAIDLGAESNAASPPDLTPIESIQDAISVFADLSVDILKKVKSAYAARERLETAILPEGKFQFASEMIEEFRSIQETETEFFETKSPDAKKLLYQVQMEQAFGYLLKGDFEPPNRDNEALKKAISIYRAVLKQFPREAAVYYRLGGAYLRSDQYAEAANVLSAGMKYLRYIPLRDRLRSQMPRVLAYALWRKRELGVRNSAGARALIGRAFGLAQQSLSAAIPGSQQESQARNSLIYYAYDYLRLGGNDDKPNKYRVVLEESVPELELTIDIKSSTDISKLDTLCRVHDFLGHRDKALVLASRLVKVMESMDRGLLDNVYRENLRFARQILSRDHRTTKPTHGGKTR